MALTQKRREELAEIVERGASWITHAGRKSALLEVASELRTGERESETEEQRAERLAAAEETERLAAEEANKAAADAAAAAAEATAKAADKAVSRSRATKSDKTAPDTTS